MTNVGQAVPVRWNIWAYLAVLLRRWGVIARGSIVGGVVAVGVALVLPPVYTTEVQFTPAESSRLSGLGSLGGIGALANLGGLLPEQQGSPFFYVALAQSDEVLRAVILRHYPVGRDSSMTLIEIDRAPGTTFDERLDREVVALNKRVSATVDRDAGTVTLKIEAGSPDLSAAIAGAFLDAINKFNVQSRNSSAHAKRLFLDARVIDLEGQLREAEDSLRNFLSTNRSYENSPTLAFEYNRLKRRVDADQDVYLTVREQDELARIDEVKDIPLITVIQPPHPPTRKTRPKRTILAIVGIAVGATIAYAIILLELYFASARSDVQQGLLELGDAWRSVRKDLPSVFRR